MDEKGAAEALPAALGANEAEIKPKEESTKPCESYRGEVSRNRSSSLCSTKEGTTIIEGHSDVAVPTKPLNEVSVASPSTPTAPPSSSADITTVCDSVPEFVPPTDLPALSVPPVVSPEGTIPEVNPLSSSESVLLTKKNNTATSISAPSPVFVRKGRGTFHCRLRMEKGVDDANTTSTSPSLNNINNHSNEQKSADHGTNLPCGSDPEKNGASTSSSAKIALEGESTQKKRTDFSSAEDMRKDFGESREGADSLSYLLFSGLKKKRTCMLIGNIFLLQSCLSVKELPFKGRKPLQFARKPLCALQMVIERPLLVSKEHVSTKIEKNNSQVSEKKSEDVRKVGSKKSESQPSSEEKWAVGTLTGDAEKENAKEPSTPVCMTSTPHNQHEDPAQLMPCLSSSSYDEKGEQKWSSKQLTMNHEKNDADGVYHLGSLSLDPVGIQNEADSELHPAAVNSQASRYGKKIPFCNDAREMSSVTSALLTTKRIDALNVYLENEVDQFLMLDDVRYRATSIRLYLGKAYGCNSQRSQMHSRGLTSQGHRGLSLSEFVQEVREESTGLYFIRDNPERVTEAVKEVYGRFNDQSALCFVKITLLSDEGQRTHTRARWDAVDNRFRIFDSETQGISLHWTIFPMEDEVEEFLSSTPPAPHDDKARGAFDKYIAYPFEVEMRSFRRWKETSHHPSKPLVEQVLHHLSTAERRVVLEGRANAYNELPLHHICSLDSDFQGGIHIEKITIERVYRKRIPQSEIIVDTASTLLLENFDEARRKGGFSRKAQEKLFYQHSTSTCIHWKLDHRRTSRENGVPIKDAVGVVIKIFAKANDPKLPVVTTKSKSPETFHETTNEISE